jgi:CDP-diacylglycerol--glycerol-3-phosphate 3-phosphatidyltransferase
MPPEKLVNVPNILSLSRIPLAAVLFVCVARGWWLPALLVFLVAAFTDWLDGWWARRWGPLTMVGRNLDTVTDKVLVCGSFVYLVPVKDSGIEAWAAVLVLSRELLVTALRGMVEATGRKFGADRWGKLKMGLQCAVLIGVLLIQWWRAEGFPTAVLAVLEPTQEVLFWAMVVATVGSGVQYAAKARTVLIAPDPPAA